MDSIYWDTVEVGDKTIYIKIHIERRRGVRMSFGKEFVLLRIPYSSSTYIKETLDKCKTWVLQTIEKKPSLLSRYHIRDYNRHPHLVVMDKTYTVELVESKNNSGRAELDGTKVCIYVPYELEGYTRSKMIRTLISKILAKAHKKSVWDRVNYYNSRYINKSINNVVLKYNTSNWGSCSTNKNINISTRTLLAPMWVVDYVIVHELCHLKEMNHSKRFWKLVEDIYPNYMEAEQWLKVKGGSCYF